MILPASAFLLCYHALSVILVGLSCRNTGRSQCLYPQCVRYSSKTTGAVQSSRKTSDGRRNLCSALEAAEGRAAKPPPRGVPASRPAPPRTLLRAEGPPRQLGKDDPAGPGRTRQAAARALRLVARRAATATGPSGSPRPPGRARALPPRRLATCEAFQSPRRVNAARPSRA